MSTFEEQIQSFQRYIIRRARLLLTIMMALAVCVLVLSVLLAREISVIECHEANDPNIVHLTSNKKVVLTSEWNQNQKALKSLQDGINKLAATKNCKDFNNALTAELKKQIADLQTDLAACRKQLTATPSAPTGANCDTYIQNAITLNKHIQELEGKIRTLSSAPTPPPNCSDCEQKVKALLTTKDELKRDIEGLKAELAQCQRTRPTPSSKIRLEGMLLPGQKINFNGVDISAMPVEATGIGTNVYVGEKQVFEPTSFRDETGASYLFRFKNQIKIVSYTITSETN
jgi:hypothetical protein